MNDPAQRDTLREYKSAGELQLNLACAQIKRSVYAVLAADALLAWLLMRAGLTHWAFVWLAASSAVSLARAYFVGRDVERAWHQVDPVLRQLPWWFFAVGLMRCWPIAIAFQGSVHETHYLVTMVMMGLAAGGIGTAVGMVRSYVAWAAPIAVTLAVAWLSLQTFESSWITALLLLMFMLMTLYVRDFGKALAVQFEERERAEAERARAESAVVARARFFAAASHDLRQPLGALRWYGDAVTAYARQLDHEPLLAVGEGISRALERAEPLVRKYLDISRIDARALEIHRHPCSVAALLENVREAFAHEAEERGLLLRTELLSPGPTLTANTDESVIRNVLDNLVGNALKFTLAGHVTLGAQWVIENNTPLVRVWVSDTGIGIPEEEQQRVFDDFYQVGNPERSHSKGVGLGLAIARRQTQLLGVDLKLTSSVGRGSTFQFDLPAVAELPATVPPAVQAVPRQKGLRVLVIDDEPDVRLSLRMMLEAESWEVRTAAGLPGAVNEIEQGFQPDALVVDYRLQGEFNGGEVVRRLRCAVTPPLAAVIVTGDTAPERLQEMKQTGLPVLHKPVRGERLIATLVDAVHRGG